jgi:heme/copper-type cytochrome/quinol oxidase subunit 1
MSIQATGAMISRAAGLILIVIGASSLLYLVPVFEPSGIVKAGWTSYSPPSTTKTTGDLMTQLRDTYYVVSSTARFYVPGATPAMAGLVMILLSRPIGRWLARGLTERDPDEVA